MSDTTTHKRHTFTALWFHFGKFGRQDVHVHPCFGEDCDCVLIGKGRECSGDPADHHRETVSAGSDGEDRPVGKPVQDGASCDGEDR